MFGEALNAILALGGLVVVVVLAIAGMFFKGKESGKAQAERDAFEKSMRESNEFQTRINAGHVAGSRPRIVPNDSDPYDRANRRKRN